MSCTITAAVLANTAHKNIVLVSPPHPGHVSAWLERNYIFCGLMRFEDGQAMASCESSPEAVCAMAEAAPTFAEFVAFKLRGRKDYIEQRARIMAAPAPMKN
jgi:hypothetical protein